MEKWNNKCVKEGDCCEGLECWRGAENWKYGVCKKLAVKKKSLVFKLVHDKIQINFPSFFQLKKKERKETFVLKIRMTACMTGIAVPGYAI